MTTAGQLRETIVLQRPTLTPDGAGGFVRTWATYATRRAEVMGTPVGREETLNDVTLAVERFTITIRFGLDVRPSDRLVWRGKTMNIRSSNDPDMRRAWLTITADAGVAVD
jgi:SPP1 family predicted phage head-tail adaptor